MLIKIFIVLSLLIMAVPDDAHAFKPPLPMKVIFEGKVTLDLRNSQLKEYLRPGYTADDLPDRAEGTIHCYSDEYGSVRLLNSYQGIWKKLTTAGMFRLNKDLVKISEHVCDKVREEMYGSDDDGESLPSWYP